MKAGRLALLAASAALLACVLLAGVLLIVRDRIDRRLQETGAILRGLAGESLETTIRVQRTMPLEAEIRIASPTAIDLELDVRDRLPVKLDVKVREEIMVPLDVQIDESITIDSAVLVEAGSKVRVKADIGLDQPVTWRLANPLKPLLNIKGNVPVDHDVEIEFPEALRVKGRIPVKFPLRRDILVPLDLEIPVDQHIDLQLAIRQQARVGFPEPLVITSDIPVVLEIPVLIPLAETPIGPALQRLAERLDTLLDP